MYSHLEKLSKELGWERTFFLEKDFVFLQCQGKKELLKEVNYAKKKKLVNAKDFFWIWFVC